MNIEDKDFFIKDLSIIEDYQIEKLIIIDNSVLSFAYHLSNGIPIVPYYEGSEDSELLLLAYYLMRICKYDDLREANIEYIKLTQSFLDEESNETRESEEEKKEEKTQTTGFKLMLNGENIKLVRRERSHYNTLRFNNFFCNLKSDLKKRTQES